MNKRPQSGEGRTQSIPFGQRAPSTMLEAHLRTFVVLYSSRLLIVLYSPNGVIIQTGTNGVQKPWKQHLRRFGRVQEERRRAQAEYKNVRGMPSRTSQTNTNGVQTSTNGRQTSTNGIQRHKRNDILDGTDD